MNSRPALLALVLLAASCIVSVDDDGNDRPPPPQGLGRSRREACSVPRKQLVRMWNGWHPERSGDVQMLLEPPNAFAYSHAEPFDHLQDVPVLLYGPGHVPAVGRVARPVVMPDLAPTLGRYLGFDFEALDGRPMEQALLPAARREDPPRLIFVVVWDGAGRNVLDEWPRSWPTARSLIPKGVWFDRASVGSAPSVTPPVHTTLGTGAYPRRHGLVDIYMRVGDRVEPSHARGPRYLLTPSLADLYDISEGNRPQVGVVASRDWHLGMIGQGSFLPGGDRDIAVLVNEPRLEWGLPGANARYYRFPEYVNHVAGLDEAVRALDVQDGVQDSMWMGEDLTDPVSVRRSPAFAEWQTRVIEEVVRREGFGADDVPDLLFTNYKQIDEVGHRWTMNSPQMEAVVRSSDRALAELIGFLDREVGRGRWVLALTADHGVVPSHEVTGGFGANKERFVADIEAAFGKGVVQQFRPTQLWIDRERLAAEGFSLEQLVAFVSRYTKGNNTPDPSELPPAERAARLFQAAFPGEVMAGLPCLRR